MLSTYLLLASCLMLHSDALNPLKKNKLQPAVTNSIINLGKMDVAFYLHPADRDQFVSPISRQSPRDLFPITSSFAQPPAEVPCPCSSILNMNKQSADSPPPSLINKLLMNNELFSFREPTTSMDCCETHEVIEENSFVFDLGNTNPFSFPRPVPQLPFLKPKQLEIFLMPQNAPVPPKSNFLFMNNLDKAQMKDEPLVKKDQISAVGDKQIKMDFGEMTDNEKADKKNKSFDTATGDRHNTMSNDIKVDVNKFETALAS